jgi:acetyl esterase/lipase
MLDPAAERYVRPGQPMGAPVDDLDLVVKEIRKAREDSPTIDGYAFPADPSKDTRYTWMRAMHEAAILPDLLTGIDGLAKQVQDGGTAVIPQHVRSLFPATFALDRKLPPIALLHGDADVMVDLEQSKKVAKDLEASGGIVLLEVVPGQGHGFDVRGVPIDIDITGDDKKLDQYSGLVKVFTFLEQAAESK